MASPSFYLRRFINHSKTINGVWNGTIRVWWKISGVNYLKRRISERTNDITEFLNYFHCNHNHVICLVLNHQNPERISSNSNTLNFLSIAWAVRPVGIHIPWKFLYNYPVFSFLKLIYSRIIKQRFLFT